MNYHMDSYGIWYLVFENHHNFQQATYVQYTYVTGLSVGGVAIGILRLTPGGWEVATAKRGKAVHAWAPPSRPSYSCDGCS